MKPKALRSKLFDVFITACVIPLVLLVTACTFSSGHTENRDYGKYMKLKIGESDRAAVYGQFRQPIDVFPTGSGKVWLYMSVDSETHFSTFIPFVGLVTGGGVETSYVTYIVFDRNGILADVESSTEEDYVNMWEGLAGLTAEAVSGRWSESQKAVSDEMKSLGIPYHKRSQMNLPPRDAIARSIPSASTKTPTTASKGNQTQTGNSTLASTASSSSRKQVEDVAEAMLCKNSISMISKSAESELWELECGDGEILVVRCFDDTCYVKQ